MHVIYDGMVLHIKDREDPDLFSKAVNAILAFDTEGYLVENDSVYYVAEGWLDPVKLHKEDAEPFLKIIRDIPREYYTKVFYTV